MNGSDDITVIIAEDHIVARTGLKCLLEQIPRVRVIDECADGDAAVDSVARLRPTIVMMDIGLPVTDGIKATAKIKMMSPGTKVIIFTSLSDEQATLMSLKAGADGYCLKSVSGEQLFLAISSVLEGVPWLDPGIAGHVLRGYMAMNERSKAQSLELSDAEIELLRLMQKGSKVSEADDEQKSGLDAAAEIIRKLLKKFEGTHLALPKMTEGDPSLDTFRTPAESPAPEPGDTIADKYLIESKVGQGGMSVVYKARHLLLEKIVAIKVLHGSLSPNSKQRFHKEAKAVSALSHPNVVATYDYGVTEAGQPFLVMEFLDGGNLADYLHKHKTIPLRTLIHIFLQICDGLAAAHAKGIIHRDLKPSNIMLIRFSPEVEQVKIVDFGIAKLASEDRASRRLTQEGELLGTPHFMSPEQCLASEIDLRSDIYSLGCILYESVTGEPAFKGGDYQLLAQQVYKTPSHLPFEQIGRPYPELLEKIIWKAMEKEPAKRFQSALEMRNELSRVMKAGKLL